ncbi:MAG: DUF6029 family protein [Saprospiraceae bacterium]|nr:DUF6029 family protein [Saprospiraceae bacterium]
MKNLILLLACLLVAISSYSQDIEPERGVFSGSIETNFNYFQKDSLIGAINIPQYDRLFTGGEMWLNLNYSIKGYDMGVRFDMFQNSNLLNPLGSYSDQGIGRWFIKRTQDKLTLEAGYLYDQIGSGIIYQAYEVRPQLIDNALYGGAASYQLMENLKLKAFTGKQKQQFSTIEGSIRGAYAEGFYSLGKEGSPISLAPGIGVVNRTTGEGVIRNILDVMKFYLTEDQVLPEYNTYLTTFYNTLSYKNITWYAEVAHKSEEVFFDADAIKQEFNAAPTFGKYVKKSGNVYYSSIGYTIGGLGLTLEGKRTENFDFRADPTLRLNLGLVNFIPPMNRLNTYRLTTRYNPATQLLSEQAYQVDVSYKFNKSWSTNLNYSNIQKLDGTQLYDEKLIEVTYKQKRKWQLTGGLQLQEYNQDIYESKPGVPMLNTVTPYLDFLYKISRKKSIRFESQYMITDQDFGSWAYGLLEVGLAPHWLFELSGMYNVSPNVNKNEIPNNPETGEKRKILYPTLGAVYINKGNRFSLRYVKQVQGVVCNGGICRLEPAFSGVRFNMTSNF